VSKCSLPPFATKRHTHHTSAPNKLNLYIAPFSARLALCRTALFSEAAKMENSNKMSMNNPFGNIFIYFIIIRVFFEYGNPPSLCDF
jgi:hypothetical protein